MRVSRPIYCRLRRASLGANLALTTLLSRRWTYNEVPGSIRPRFDSPAYRCAKQIVAMCIALGIAGVFQIFILRQPARQTLRQKLAQVSWKLNGLSVLLSYLTEAVMPMVEVRRALERSSSFEKAQSDPHCDPEHSQDSTNHEPPDWDAVKVVQKELINREVEIQGELLALMPIMKWVLPRLSPPCRTG